MSSSGKGLKLTGDEKTALNNSAVVALVEDDARVREALAFQLSTAGFKVISYPSAQGLLARDPAEFDCVVADIFMPKIDGLALQEQLAKTGKFISIVFVTGRGDLSIGVQAMKRGAVDVLEKPVNDAELLAAVARGIERSRAERAAQTRKLDVNAKFSSLPARQREVFTLITAGLLNKQVAAELRISERTVKVHRERLRRRMGADSLAELSRMAEVLRIHPAGSANVGS